MASWWSWACFFCVISLVVGGEDAEKSSNETSDRYAISRVFRDGDKIAHVYDAAMPHRKTEALSQLLTTVPGGWQFVYPVSDLGKESLNNGDVHWVNFLSPDFLKDSIIGSVCRNIFRRMNRGVQYFPREVFGTMLLRGMAPVLIDNKDDGDELYVRIFLTQGLTKNDYGQLTLYTEDKEFVLGSVFPKFKRLVVFNGSTPFIMKPPAMGNSQAEYSLFIKWTPNITKYEQGLKAFEELQAQRETRNSAPFPTLFNLSDEEINLTPQLSKHITDIQYDKFGNHVAIFDDVFSEIELNTLRRYLVGRDGVLRYNGYARNENDDNDNVNWISAYEISEFIKSKAWNVVYDMAVYLSGRTGWYPYDVSMNTVQNSHHTRFHTDCMEDEFEYTFLLYINPNWTADTYGETMFTDHRVGYENMRGKKEQYDAKAIVQPKYGRIAMFRNIINHSARPPCPHFFDSRYTFAVKVSVNKRIAQAKTLQELMEFVQEGQEGYDLYEGLRAQKYNDVVPGEPKQFIDNNLVKFQEVKSKMEVENKQHLLSLLAGLPPRPI